MDNLDAKAPPYLEKRVLEARFWPKTRRSSKGCLKWDGAKCKRVGQRPDEGQIRVRVATGRYKVLSASRVAWWLAGNGWPEAGAQLRHKCRFRNCVEVRHLELVTLAERTKLTKEIRAEIKQLYAVRVAVWREVFGKLGVTRQPSAISVAARRLWVSRHTIERFVAGRPMSPAHWMTEELDLEGLREAYELAERDADDIRKKLKSVEAYSIKNLAKKYGVVTSAIGRALYAD